MFKICPSWVNSNKKKKGGGKNRDRERRADANKKFNSNRTSNFIHCVSLPGQLHLIKSESSETDNLPNWNRCDRQQMAKFCRHRGRGNLNRWQRWNLLTASYRNLESSFGLPRDLCKLHTSPCGDFGVK